MKRIISAGGIVFDDQGEVLLTKSGSLRDESQKHWKFAKGHIEEGETSEMAALREVEEETGIKAKIIEKLGDSKYTYKYKDQEIFKIVVMFLMEYISGEPVPQVGEIDEVGWYSKEEALNMLSFPADKKLLQKAIDLINNNDSLINNR